ncbi:MAG: hypothetical protein L0Y61_08720 [Epsilonproteobacteria bacterium]|nr:hypothetical protein [Campylobacterota bacterium]
MTFEEFCSKNENWDKEDNKKLKKQDSNFVSCDERKTSEKNKFDEYEKIYGKSKVDECCKKQGNRSRDDFENCLKGKL